MGMGTKKRRIGRWIVGSIVGMALLIGAMPTLLYIPMVQQLAAQWGAAWLTERLNIKVQIESIHLRFPMRLEVKGLHMGTFLRIEEARTDIRLRPLREGVVKVNYLSVWGIDFRGDSLMKETTTNLMLKQLIVNNITYRPKEKSLQINSLLLNDGDIQIVQDGKRATRKDTTLRMPIALRISEVGIRRMSGDFSNESMQVSASANDIALHEVVADTAMQITLLQGEITEGEATLKQPDKEPWRVTELMLRGKAMSYTPQEASGRLTHLACKESHGVDLREGSMTFVWQEGRVGMPDLSLRTPHSLFQGHLYSLDYSTTEIAFDADLDAHIGHADMQNLIRNTRLATAEVASLYPSETLHISIAANGSMESLRVNRCLLSLPTAFDINMQGELRHIGIPTQREVWCLWEGTTYDLRGMSRLFGTEQISLPYGISHRGNLCYAPDTTHALCILAFDEGRATLEGSYNAENSTYQLDLQTDSLNIKRLLPHEEWGIVSLQAQARGSLITPHHAATLQLHALQWRELNLSHTTAQITLNEGHLQAHASCRDTLMQWDLATDIKHTPRALRANLAAHLYDLDLRALQVANTDLRPSLSCHATLLADSAKRYSLDLSLSDILLATPTDTLRPLPIALQGMLMGDTTLLAIQAGGIASEYITLGDISLTASRLGNHLQAQWQASEIALHTPEVELQSGASGTLTWSMPLVPDSLQGVVRLAPLRCSLPTYDLALHTADTLAIPLRQGTLLLSALPLYPAGDTPLLIDGTIALLGDSPILQLLLTARGVDLLQAKTTPSPHTLLHGKALVDGSVELRGPLDDLTLRGYLHLLHGSAIRYIYRNALLTSGNQLDRVVTFVSFNADSTATAPTKGLTPRTFTLDLDIEIDPTVEVEASLGKSQQNSAQLQGGGMLSLQYTPTLGLHLAGTYTIGSGHLMANIPLFHASRMTLRPSSTLTWTGNPANPLLNLAAEERIRASVTLDGSPQSVLFVAGVSLTGSAEDLDLLFTLTAPENATMQNTLATLSPDERGKLAVALLTTGLYLGEGGTGNLMNAALMSLLQSQIDDLSRDAFRTVDVSIDIAPQLDGVSGVSTRTDYSFSLSKRLWDDRLRITLGGSVTSTGQRLESSAVIDNASLEWRIVPTGSQYLRFFYERQYENILEGEVRKTGLGYGFRRKF